MNFFFTKHISNASAVLITELHNLLGLTDSLEEFPRANRRSDSLTPHPVSSMRPANGKEEHHSEGKARQHAILQETTQPLFHVNSTDFHKLPRTVSSDIFMFYSLVPKTYNEPTKS